MREGALPVGYPATKTAIFLSYRREDSIETAGHMYSWLSMRLPQQLIFLDVRSIWPGANYRTEMAMALEEAEVVLVIIGRSWSAITRPEGLVRRLEEPDDAVRQEIELALARGKTIIPILTQGITMPSRADLPDSIRAFADLNALPVRPEPDFDNDMRTLRTAIDRLSPGLPWHAPSVPMSAPPLVPGYPPPAQTRSQPQPAPTAKSTSIVSRVRRIFRSR